MQSYASYKPSAIPWIEELPVHWGEEKGKWLHRFRKDLNNRKQCDNVLSLTLRGVVNNDPDDPEGLVPKDYRTYQIFEKDDLVFKLIDLENFRTSRVGLVHERGIMSPAYLRVQPGKEHNPRYFYYYYFTLYQQGVYNKLGAGVRSTLGPTDLLEIGVPVPSKEEQDRIVAFLDQKTAEIDAAIAKKERLIELLAEQRSILIRNAVTRGLSSSAAMCDSGVTWLGAIPAHWELKPLKRLVDFIGGCTPNKNTAAFWNGDIPWVSPKDMKQEKISRSQDYITNLALNKTSVKLIQVGAVLVVVRGMILSRIFPAAVTELPVTINQDMKGLIPKKWIDAEFLRYVLSGHEAHILDLTEESGHGTKTMPTDKLGAFPVVVPPLAEQIEIRKHCHEISASVEKVIEKTRRQLTQLQELKVTLVAVSVLGKASL